MRPRKKILYVDSDEESMSMRKFMLETTAKYWVIPVNTSASAVAVLGQADPYVIDLLLLAKTDHDLILLVAQLHPTVPVLVADGTSAEIKESVRIAVMRKRGPKKHYPQPETEVAA